MSFSPPLSLSAAASSVPFLDLRAEHAELAEQLSQAVSRVIAQGTYILGEELERFEAAFAEQVGASHCVGVGCGLDALELALRARDIGPGDEVIVPGHTFIATWLAVGGVGATPVPVEPLPGAFNLDPDAVSAAIGPRTAAIVPVHLYGEPAELARLRELARRHGLALIDDAAQAHGATLDGEAIGGGTDASAWSFYPSKNLGALGDGGAVTTDDAALAARLRRLRNYGAEEKYVHLDIGVNSRLDELQAALLSCKLPRLDAANNHRRTVAGRYRHGLEDLPLVLPAADLRPDAETRHVFHLYVVRTTERDRLQTALAAAGVQTGIHYPLPCHRQPAFAGALTAELPTCDRLAAEVLSLPMGPHLSEPDTDRVIACVRDFFGRDA